MDEAHLDPPSPTKPRKKRLPKACGSCRQSKVRCDGKRPCTRCASLKKQCHFVERSKDESETKIESLEQEIDSLKRRLDLRETLLENAGLSQQGDAASVGVSEGSNALSALPPRLPGSVGSQASPVNETGSVSSGAMICPPETYQAHYSPLDQQRKRKRSHFEVGNAAMPDFVTLGLLSEAEAAEYFSLFFEGCHKYVPIFDPAYDTIESVRQRSGLLFCSVCAVGCRVAKGIDSQHWHTLNLHTQRMVNATITNPAAASVETVQALLVRACYVTERSLLVAVATRMAIDLGLPDAYDTLSARLVARKASSGTREAAGSTEDDAALMRKTRTWLQLLVLGHILHVDAGDLAAFRFRAAPRRCRILLGSPHSTNLDLYLFSQVELNAMRAKTYATLAQCASTADNEEIMDMVGDAKVDVDVWFNDWARMYEPHLERMPWLMSNLRVQRCWADSMAMCRAVRASGVENVNAMSDTQKTILLMAKDSLREHLDVILEKPRSYLYSLRSAMDFVWAKNAFCYLLLLKLSMLLPDGESETTRRLLLDRGRELLEELRRASGEGSRSNTSSLYLQLVQTSIEKYGHALAGEGSESHHRGEFHAPSMEDHRASPYSPNATELREVEGHGHTELESFVPRQFVFEWDFPGLTLFSSRPTTEDNWLDDFLTGDFDMGGDSMHGLTWAGFDFTT